MKIYIPHNKLAFLLGLLIISNQLAGQVAGDEDPEMLNRAKQRDQVVIDEAVNGWWTASMKTHDRRIQWWREAKFGMFIHWGIYSLPGGEWKGQKVSGYAEHLMRKEKITRADYLALAHRFNPVKFNAEQWILQAKKAGMKYFIITAKHHDGFAMYDSKISDFTIVQQTPFKRDPMAELAAAAKKHGIRFGFYYSHAFDWEHPDAPGNDWEYENPGGDRLIGGARWYDEHPDWLPKAKKYVDEKAIPQIKELLTKYHPDILWFDTPHKLPLSENLRILKAIRETDNTVVINGRLARNGNTNFGDYLNTADRPAEFFPVNSTTWEAIPTTNESYGYHKFDSSHKPVSHFIQLLAKAASRGGNLLMNIGPMGNGAFDEKDLAILNGIGKWMEINGESIYGTTAGILPLQSWGVSTCKDNKLYLHVFDRPADGKIYVGGLKNTPGKIYLLADKKKQLAANRISEKDLVISLPASVPPSVNTVIVIELNDKPREDTVRVIAPNITGNRLLAFDAVLNGKGFKFGDGKTNRYYVEGWKSMEQHLSWTIRTLRPANFSMQVKYLAPEATSGGSYAIIVNHDGAGSTQELFHTSFNVTAAPASTTVITGDAGNIFLPAGTYTIRVVPVTIAKEELMKLLELQLIQN